MPAMRDALLDRTHLRTAWRHQRHLARACARSIDADGFRRRQRVVDVEYCLRDGMYRHSQARLTTMSPATVREAANSTSAQQKASAGITYIASCRPTARNASVIAGAPASAIARFARNTESLPVR